MKKVLVLAAGVIVAAAFNGTADAARWNGVVVAKDAKRKAVVTVSRGSVRTVRAPAKFRRLRVGQRVAVTAPRCRTARSPQRSYGDRAASPAFAFGVSSSGTTGALGA